MKNQPTPESKEDLKDWFTVLKKWGCPPQVWLPLTECLRSEKKKSEELGYDKAINEEYKEDIAEHLKSQAKEEMKKDFQKLIAEEMLTCHQTGEKTSRLTSLANKISKN